MISPIAPWLRQKRLSCIFAVFSCSSKILFEHKSYDFQQVLQLLLRKVVKTDNSSEIHLQQLLKDFKSERFWKFLGERTTALSLVHKGFKVPKGNEFELELHQSLRQLLQL